jgi:hypothetical protein
MEVLLSGFSANMYSAKRSDIIWIGGMLACFLITFLHTFLVDLKYAARGGVQQSVDPRGRSIFAILQELNSFIGKDDRLLAFRSAEAGFYLDRHVVCPTDPELDAAYRMSDPEQLRKFLLSQRIMFILAAEDPKYFAQSKTLFAEFVKDSDYVETVARAEGYFAVKLK